MQDQALPAHCVSMRVTAFEDLSGNHASIYLLGEAVHKWALLQVCTVLSTVDTRVDPSQPWKSGLESPHG